LLEADADTGSEFDAELLDDDDDDDDDADDSVQSQLK